MISIVDDDVCARAAVEALVQSLGYVAVIFTSAEEFLGSNHVDDTSCLITDVHMPGLEWRGVASASSGRWLRGAYNIYFRSC